MSKNSEKWNQRHKSAKHTIPEPVAALKENSYLLPDKGNALDLACGLGGNALFMAKAGLSVSAWDYSSVAIDYLIRRSIKDNIYIDAKVRDITLDPPKAETFDIIVVSYFLDRSINRSIVEALRPNGLIFYQTYTQDKVSEIGPHNTDYLLKENELLEIFSDLKVRAYREEKYCGDTKKGLRNEALFIGQKKSL